jgi:hypothetical protein
MGASLPSRHGVQGHYSEQANPRRALLTLLLECLPSGVSTLESKYQQGKT